MAKANVCAAVRNVVGKDHNDDDGGFCLITGFSVHESSLSFAHIVVGAMPCAVVSLLVDPWFMLLIDSQTTNSSGFGINPIGV